MVDAVIGRAVVRVAGDLSGLDADLKRARSQFQEVGEQMTRLGTGLTAAITVPIAGLTTAIARSAVGFESAFAGVQKTVDATAEQFDTLEQSIIDMSTRLPISANQIANVAQAAGQLGVGIEDIEAFSETMIRMGASTDLTADQAAVAFARIASASGMPLEQVDQLGSAIVALGNNFAATESDIIEISTRFAGIARTVGVSAQDVAAFSAVVRQAGLQTEAAGSAIGRIMVEIANSVASGGEQLEQFASVAGMSTAQFQQAFQEDATNAIVTFLGGLNQLEHQGENVFGVLDSLGLAEIRTRQATLGLAGSYDSLVDAVELSRTEFEVNNALVRESEQRFGTAENQLVTFINKLVAVGLTLRDDVIAAINSTIGTLDPLIGILDRAVQWFGNLDDRTKVVIATIGALLAALGPILVTIGVLSATVIPGLITAFGLLTAPITGSIALTGAIGAALVAFIATNEEAQRHLVAIWNAIAEFFGLITDEMRRVWNVYGKDLTRIAEQVWNLISSIFENALQVIASVMQFITSSIRMDFEGQMNALKNVIQAVWDVIVQILRTAVNIIATIFGVDLESVVGGIMRAWGSLSGFFRSLWNSIIGTFESARRTIDSIAGAVSSLLSRISGDRRSAQNEARSAERAADRAARARREALSAGQFGSVPRGIPLMKEGGVIRQPGLAVVGERGPELVNLPRGAEVTPLDQAGGRDVKVIQEIHVDASPSDLQRYTERALRKLAVQWEVR